MSEDKTSMQAATVGPHRKIIPARGGAVDMAAALTAPAIVLGLMATYLTAPGFYLTWVLNAQQRETQIVEVVTFICSAAAGVLLLFAGVRLLRHAAGDPVVARGIKGVVQRYAGVGIVLLTAAAALFFAGEEISWGQTYLGWKTPDGYRQFSVETNLHNTDLPIQSLGSLFLLAVFMGLPVLWRLQGDRLPRSCALAVPEWPVALAVVVAFAWKEYKTLYRALYDVEQAPTRFYIDFVEQINEHKELLAAVALLMYALYRLAAIARPKGTRP